MATAHLLTFISFFINSGLFYRAHLRDIRDRSVLRLFEATDIGGGAFPGAVGVGSVAMPAGAATCSGPSSWDQVIYASETGPCWLHSCRGNERYNQIKGELEELKDWEFNYKGNESIYLNLQTEHSVVVTLKSSGSFKPSAALYRFPSPKSDAESRRFT